MVKAFVLAAGAGTRLRPLTYETPKPMVPVVNRPVIHHVLDNLGPWDPRPRQYEFARLALGYTVMSKRKLLQLVNEKRVSGWDDPRMPTIAGMRRRGVTPEALRDFAELIGVAKNNSVVDIGKFEFAVRGDLETRSPRALAVLDPVRLVVTTWPEEKVEELDVVMRAHAGGNRLEHVRIEDAGGRIIGIRGISREVTERRQAEETLRRSEARQPLQSAPRDVAPV